MVTITGSAFQKTSKVAFNGTSATFTINGATQVTATVPAAATTGPITLTTPGGTSATSTNFTVTAAPQITNFSPSSGPVGTSVTITGTAFGNASSVSFNGTSASFTINSATQVTATVPAAATTGPITLTTPGGTATSATNYTVTIAPPQITNFSPSSGPVGTTVTITGTAFTNTSDVSFNGTSATFTTNSATQVTATVPATATTGPITLTTPGGTATTTTDFTVTIAPPQITNFSPSSGPVGTTVTITGTAFTNTSSVSFNGTSATFTVTNSTQVTATVPATATTGPITLTTPGGTATTTTSYTVTTASASYAVYVGYYDTHHTDTTQPKPSPWMLSPNVLFIGQNDEGNTTTLGNWDTSAVRIQNLTGAPLSNVHVTVDIPVVYPSGTSTHHFDLWGTRTVPAGGSLILAQTAYENFDGSDYNSKAGQYGQDPSLCTNPNDISTGIPVVHVTVGSTTTDFHDSHQILNTRGVDGAGCLPPVASPTRDDESSAWQALGS